MTATGFAGQRALENAWSLAGVEAAGQVSLVLHLSGEAHHQEGAWQGEVSTLDKTIMAQGQAVCQVPHKTGGMIDHTDRMDTLPDLQLMQGHLSWTAWALPLYGTTEGQQGKLTLLLSRPCLLLRYVDFANLQPDFPLALTCTCYCSPQGLGNVCHQLWLLMGRRSSYHRYSQHVCRSH